MSEINLLQARIYSFEDSFQDNQQWAQLTLRLVYNQEESNDREDDIALYERKLCDQLNHRDWKLAYFLSESEYKMLH